MAEVDGITLAVAIQGVRDMCARLEELLTSETLSDRGDLEDLLVSYQRAAARLKDAYLQELAKGPSNLPSYDELVQR